MEKSLADIKIELPELANSFGALFLQTMKEGALSMKQKELIAMGIAIALRCESCIRVHLEKCLAAGVNKKEILETASVAVMMQGGPAYTMLPSILEALESVK